MSRMKDLDIVNDDDNEEGQTLSSSSKHHKHDRKPTGDDHYSDWLLRMYYLLNQRSMVWVKVCFFVAPPIVIFLFSLFVSSLTAHVIAFGALVVSFAFMIFSVWILCEILDKDQGSREMQDVSDPIKEGSEGFFITQYGTIFKLALVCSFLLFLVYLSRSPASG